MEGANGLNAGVLLNPLTEEFDDDNGLPLPSTKVDYHLKNLLASHFGNPDLTPQEIADASRTTAAAAALAAKAARATADEKAAAAAKAVAAAKAALDLIASFHNTNQPVANPREKPAAADDLLYSKDEELPSNLQLGDVSQGIMSNSSWSCERKNDQCEVPIGLGERPNTEHDISKTVDFNGLGMELGSSTLNESAGGEGAKEGIQVTRKRGRPKSK